VVVVLDSLFFYIYVSFLVPLTCCMYLPSINLINKKRKKVH